MSTTADLVRIAAIKETTFGTTPATPAFEVLRYSSESITQQQNTVESTEISSSRGVSDAIQAGATTSGDITAELYANDTFEDFMASVLGDDDGWTANVIIPGSLREGYTFEKSIIQGIGGYLYYRYAGCTVSSCAISIAANEPVTVTYGVIGGVLSYGATIITGATYTAANPTAVNAPAMVASNATLTWGGALTGVGASAVSDLAFTIDSQNRGTQVIGTLGDYDTVLGRLKVTGSATVYFSNNVPMAALLAATDATLHVALTDNAGTPNTYDVYMDRIRVTQATLVAGGTGTDVVYQMEFEALEISGGDQVRIVRN